MSDYQKYDKFQIEQLKRDADIRLFIPGCDESKRDQKIACPVCGQKKFSVVHKAGKNLAKCFACDLCFTNGVAAVMKLEGKDFLSAVEYVAERANVVLIPREQKRRERVDRLKDSSVKSFCSQQLEASGLTMEDIVAHVLDSQGRDSWEVPMRKGGIDAPFQPNDTDDEMLIYYYGLDGRPKTYIPRGNNGRPKPYVRVRWSNPDVHTDADGKPAKYKTPAGAPSQVYIPQYIRSKYQAAEPIDTLFIQEGEKKAEKACKHGIPSIGIQGINNFGTTQDGLLQDIQYLVKKCAVRNVVLLMDSDWQGLHRNIITGDDITKRPNSFCKAVIKFKVFINSLHNRGYSVDVWWGHVNDNEAGDKGVDDLLCNTLKGREPELLAAIDEAMHAHNGKSTLVDIHKITSISDKQIEDFWLLNDDQAFYDLHKERLVDVETFKIKRIRYKVEKGKLVQVNRYSSDIDIWSIELDSKDRKKVVFNALETFEFLKANGFFRLRTVNSDGTVTFDFIRIDDGIIERTSPVEIRDFIRDYIDSTCREYIVKNFFREKMDSILADKKMENLARIENDFDDFKPELQKLYYNNGAVEITSGGIVAEQPMCNVWRTRILPRKFRRVPIISDISFVDGNFLVYLTEEGKRCEFLQYLINTSNSFFTHDEPRELTPAEHSELMRHLVNKITSIGFLLCEYKFPTECKAVVVQDHRMAEVGASNGGSGKSILGTAIGKVIPQIVFDGKKDETGQFFFERVSLATRNLFIDDVRTNFNFERLFPMITGDMIIDRKNIGALEIPLEKSPKILITTNHAINKSEEDATRRRIIYMEVSEWYNPEHTVIDDFHHMLFNDWAADDQWVLFDNLMAECVMYYMRSFEQHWHREGVGAVPPPMDNIRLRSLRQEMGEGFFQWAEEYFDPSGSKLNERVPRKEMYQAFVDNIGHGGHSVSPTGFRRKLESFCKFKGYDLNIRSKDKSGRSYVDWRKKNKSESFIGLADKSGGAEYFTVYSPDEENNLKPF